MQQLFFIFTGLIILQVSFCIRIEEIDLPKEDNLSYGTFISGQIIGIGQVLGSDTDEHDASSDSSDSSRGEVDPSKIYFVTFNSNGQEIERTKITSDSRPRGCEPSDLLTIVVHGWRADCKTDWVQALVKSKKLYNFATFVLNFSIIFYIYDRSSYL